MNDRTRLGRIQDVDVTAERSVAPAFGLMWLLFSLIGMRFFKLRPGAALGGGLLVALLHFFSELWHQLGHARAARATGYPMESIHLWTALGTSVYPEDEGAVPPEAHVERALGGPKVSALLTIGASAVALLAWPIGGLARMVTSLFALDNLLVFTLGALLPLPYP
jgi:Zn-dependent protease